MLSWSFKSEGLESVGVVEGRRAVLAFGLIDPRYSLCR